MKKKHMIVKLPQEKENMDKIVSDENHEVQFVSISSVLLDGKVQHYAFVLWHDAEYGDHMF